jgi:hypothetical protein
MTDPPRLDATTGASDDTERAELGAPGSLRAALSR